MEPKQYKKHPLIPASVTIGPHKIKVEFDASIEEYGHFVYQDLIIRIHPKLSQSVQYETYCHEVVEAINILGEYKLSHKTIQGFGTYLAQAFAK